MMNRRMVMGAVALVALFAAQNARADVSKNVQKKFRGDILVSSEMLPTTFETDAEAIKQLKKAAQKSVKSYNQDGLATWSFHFIAFLKKKPGTTQLSLDFYTTDKEKLFVANKRLAGIDPGLTLLQSRIEINEDEGLNKGRTYNVKLTGQVKGREVVFATTTLNMK